MSKKETTSADEPVEESYTDDNFSDSDSEDGGVPFAPESPSFQTSPGLSERIRGDATEVQTVSSTESTPSSNPPDSGQSSNAAPIHVGNAQGTVTWHVTLSLPALQAVYAQITAPEFPRLSRPPISFDELTRDHWRQLQMLATTRDRRYLPTSALSRDFERRMEERNRAKSRK